MKLTNRDAMAYVVWRWCDINFGRGRVSVAAAEAMVDEMLGMATARMRRHARRPWQPSNSPGLTVVR